MKFILLLLFIFLLQSCNTTKFELGKYCYRYPQGMFNGCLSLTTDSTFEFEFAGDMIHYVGQGAYKKLNRKGMELTLTNPVISKRWDFEVKERIVYNNTIFKVVFDTINIIVYDTMDGPKYFRIRGNKFFFADSSYKISTFKTNHRSKIRRYIFFGTRYRNKKNYIRYIGMRDY